ncbi:hypothetical protein KL916_005432 [Ogataea parapolymorpha]|nr:hypothetical protein KL916_005432 [Ogataea parapolymorpha]
MAGSIDTNEHDVSLSLEKSTILSLVITWSNLTSVTGLILSSTSNKLAALLLNTEMLFPVARITSRAGKFFSASIESNLLNRMSILISVLSCRKNDGRSLDSLLAASCNTSRFTRFDTESGISEMLLYERSSRFRPAILVSGSGMFLSLFDERFKLCRLCNSANDAGSVEMRLHARFSVVRVVIFEISGGISLI